MGERFGVSEFYVDALSPTHSYAPALTHPLTLITNHQTSLILPARTVRETPLSRSDLVHSGAAPLGATPNFRAVVYVCMTPASLTPEAAYEQKVKF